MSKLVLQLRLQNFTKSCWKLKNEGGERNDSGEKEELVSMTRHCLQVTWILGD
jgi:hypothetical protein